MNPDKLNNLQIYLYVGSNGWCPIVEFFEKHMPSNDCGMVYTFVSVNGAIWLNAQEVKNRICLCPKYLQKYIELFSY